MDELSKEQLEHIERMKRGPVAKPLPPPKPAEPVSEQAIQEHLRQSRVVQAQALLNETDHKALRHQTGEKLRSDEWFAWRESLREVIRSGGAYPLADEPN